MLNHTPIHKTPFLDACLKHNSAVIAIVNVPHYHDITEFPSELFDAKNAVVFCHQKLQNNPDGIGKNVNVNRA